MNELPEEKLDDAVTVLDPKVNEFFSVDSAEQCEFDGILDKGHVYLRLLEV